MRSDFKSHPTDDPMQTFLRKSPVLVGNHSISTESGRKDYEAAFAV